MRPAVFLLLLACAPAQPRQETFPYARAHRECGPADGPAIRIQLSKVDMPPDLREQPAAPYLDLLVNTSQRRLGRSFPIEPEGRGRQTTGYAQLCGTSGDCASAGSGTIHLDELQADSLLTGRYQLELGDGDRMTGRFQARWIEVPLFCG